MNLQRTFLAVAVAFAVAACAPIPPPSVAVACPKGPPTGARCLRGTDARGAPYLIAVPAQWNGVLIVHAHGGPPLEIRASRADEDIARWGFLLQAGYAYAASVYREGGVAVRSAAEDTERVRRIFVANVGAPRRTILHGQSWGGNVAAKAAEMYAAPGARSPYDAVLLTSGVIAGGPRAYDFRLDLRVVYQHYCGNHPRASEPQYPLWMGYPAGQRMGNKEIAARVAECLGTRASRTPEQARKAKAIADVVRIPESSIASHLAWGTMHFQDVVRRTQGNPFGNVGARYRGSDDDAALNRAVARYRADPAAVARFDADAGLDGRIGVPVLTLHAIHDPTAFVEMESSFREAMAAAGTADHLVQTFGDYAVHSFLAAPDYIAELEALLAWVDHGAKPVAARIAERCHAFEATFGPGCRFVPDYRPEPLDHRVAPRERP
jgi:hypothetical protein